jgi:N-glycosylase/DNA lyase
MRDYKFGKGGKHKSLTKATYDAIGDHFRGLWGKEAGWAHSVLFTADLKAFAEVGIEKTTTSTKSRKKIKEEGADSDVEMEEVVEEEEEKVKVEEWATVEEGTKNTIREETIVTTQRAKRRRIKAEDEMKLDTGMVATTLAERVKRRKRR